MSLDNNNAKSYGEKCAILLQIRAAVSSDGDGLMVSVQAFCSADPSSIHAEVVLKMLF